MCYKHNPVKYVTKIFQYIYKSIKYEKQMVCCKFSHIIYKLFINIQKTIIISYIFY